MAAKLSMEDQMRARFHEATAERATLVAKAKPFRDDYDAISAEITEIQEARLKPAAAKAQEIEAEMFDVDVEIGRITRFLREGNFAATGDAPAPKKS